MNQIQNWCQSCAMPLDDINFQGTNADGSNNIEYCKYCFENGRFTTDLTMDDMIEICVPMTSRGNPWPDADTARKAMKGLFPNLKRWKVK